MDVPTLVPLPGIDTGTGGATCAWRLTPGVQMLWRGDGSFQLEHAGGGVVVTGLDRALAATLARPPRDDDRPARTRPGRVPGPAPVDLTALHRLAELGFVAAHPAPPLPDPRTRRRRPGRTGPRAAAPALADLDPECDRGIEIDVEIDVEVEVGVDATVELETGGTDRRPAVVRRLARVDVTGLTPVSAYVGALLGAAGVGAVGFPTAGVVRRRHLLPGGLSTADEGRRFAAAAADVVARAAPRTDVAPRPDGEPDLVVTCLDAPMEPELRALLHRTRRAHLAVHVDANRAEVGPLVLPGVSACLRCADLHRLDHDPAWSVLAVQLMGRAGSGEPPDPDLAARTGALAAAVALRWLDGDPTAGGTLDGSYELRSGWVSPRRRGRRPHPDCGCRASWG